MAVSDYKKNKGKKLTEKQKKKREERKEERLKKEERDVLKDYGKIKTQHFLRQLRYRVMMVDTSASIFWRRKINVTSMVESISWSDTKTTLTGSISGTHPQTEKRDRRFQIKDGCLLLLEAYVGGKWQNVWVMRVQTPSEDAGSGAGSYELADDSILIALNEGDFKYVNKDKKKKWKADNLTRDVAREWGFKVGNLPKCEEFLDDIEEKKASPLSVIAKAWKQESEATGVKYVMTWRHGKIEISRLRRNKNLYSLKELIESATVSRDRGQKFFTALRIVGSIKDGEKKKKKLDIEIEHPKAVKRYGKIVKIHNLDNTATSREKVVKAGKRRLSRSIMKKTQPTISLSHVGIPWIRRGDAVEIRLPKYGFKGKKRPVPPFEGGYYNILFVTGIEHTLDSSGHHMDVSFTVDDPIAEMKDALREKKDKDDRKKKRDARGDRNNRNNNGGNDAP